MQQYYTSIVALTEFAMIIMAICVRGSLSLKREKKRLFYLLFAVTGVGLLCEWSFSTLSGQPSDNRVFLAMLKAIEFSLVPVVSLTVCAIVRDEAPPFAVWAAAGVHALLELLSGVFGFIWSVSDEGILVHGPAVFILFAFVAAALVYTVIVLFITTRRHQYKGCLFLVLLLLLLACGGTVQLMDRTQPTGWPAAAMGGMLLAVFSSEMILQRDTLTQLLNRRDFESQLDNITQKVTFFFFDIDHFRTVNELRGHAYGDECLTKIGALIREVYSLRGKCYRIGGDEFCVITQGHAADAKSLNTIFFERAGKLRAADPGFPYLSVGYVYFDPENHNIQDCMKEAAEMMARYKSRRRAPHHSQAGNPANAAGEKAET